MKRFLVFLLVGLVGAPWSVFTAAVPRGCPMPKAATACGYCAPSSAAPTSDGAMLRAGCCRFLPTPERVLAQAGSLGSSAKPAHSPDGAAIETPDFGAIPAPFHARFRDSIGASPPHAPPTRTTHLLL